MYFFVLDNLIGARSPADKADRIVGRSTDVTVLPLRMMLCLKWLASKLSHSRMSPARRLDAVFADWDRTCSEATANGMETCGSGGADGADMAGIDNIARALARRCGVLLWAGGTSGTFTPEIAPNKGKGALVLWTTTRGNVYPAALYHSRGGRLYIFFAGAGELNGIKADRFFEEFRSGVDTPALLEPLSTLHIYDANRMGTTEEAPYVEMAPVSPVQPIYESIYEAVVPLGGDQPAIYDNLRRTAKR